MVNNTVEENLGNSDHKINNVIAKPHLTENRVKVFDFKMFTLIDLGTYFQPLTEIRNLRTKTIFKCEKIQINL